LSLNDQVMDSRVQPLVEQATGGVSAMAWLAVEPSFISSTALAATESSGASSLLY
jgi:hypothetical protein